MKEKETQVYCGPDILGVAKQFSVYTNGLPEGLEQLANKIPAMRGLIVPVEKLAETRSELQKQESAKHNIFLKVKNEVEKGAK